MKQTIRIIGGRYRGKKLHFPAVAGLRPTSDRTRETLFNWLMNDVHHAHCLDAFAGSGALGFEAFSRGAEKVVLIEQQPSAYQHLLQHADFFRTHQHDSTQLLILKEDARQFLNNAKERFNIIFLDPPFAYNYLPSCIEAIEKNNLLHPHGFLYVEAPEEILLDPSLWKTLKLKRTGQVVYGLYQKQ